MPYNNTPIAPPAEVTGNVALPRESSVLLAPPCATVSIMVITKMDLQVLANDYCRTHFLLYPHTTDEGFSRPRPKDHKRRP